MCVLCAEFLLLIVALYYMRVRLGALKVQEWKLQDWN